MAKDDNKDVPKEGELQPTEDIEKDETMPEETESRADEPTNDDDTPEDLPEPVEAPEPQTEKTTEKEGKLKQFLHTKKGKITAAVLGVLLVVAVLLIVPYTRYMMLGTVIKKDVTVTAIDSSLDKPVNDAKVTIAGQTGKTDDEGKAIVRSVPVGEHAATISKKYFKDTKKTIMVPLFGNPKTIESSLEATGRQVSVVVQHTITKKPLEKAIISVLDTSATTDKNGEALLVLPADKETAKATIKLDGYNDATTEVQITEQKTDKNTFSLTPKGKVYFLSKRTGTIDVMKSNLDGTDAKVVLKGTGREDEYGTVLLASRDWNYLALKSRRDSDEPKLYLINTANEKMTVMDEGNASFTPVGWHGDRFIYEVTRSDSKLWEPKSERLKSYSATAKQITILDETRAEGNNGYNYVRESIRNPYILKNKVVYIKDWHAYSDWDLNNKKISIMEVSSDGSGKKVVSKPSGAKNTGIQAKLYEPEELYFQIWKYNTEERLYFEYENGSVHQKTNIDRATFDQFYPTYLLSPSDKATFWYEPRDGKNTLFTGNELGNKAKEIANHTDYTPYGWFGDDYLLVSKEGSELYIMSRDGSNAVKVTNYHKPRVDFRGYGYGYGGF